MVILVLMNERELIFSFVNRFPWIVAILCILLAVFVTFPKIQKMFQIQGNLPGATSEMQTVVQKNQSRSRASDYWEITTDSGFNERITFEAWSKLNIGDLIELRRIGPSNELYAKDGIFTEAGNFIFDYVLLFLEICGALFFSYKFLNMRKPVS
jgi:hypothetical protein